MGSSIAVIDYGAGNTLNVLRAFDYQGFNTGLVSSVSDLHKYSHIVLPGVGAFPFGMKNLVERKLAHVIIDRVQEQKPVLGICLGMQLLAEVGHENNVVPGIGLIGGEVVHLGRLGQESNGARVPHTGWSSVNWRNQTESGVDQILGSAYFNHSYFLNQPEEAQVLATTVFGNVDLAVVVQSGSLCAVQFHPEKSGKAGLNLLRVWVEGGSL